MVGWGRVGQVGLVGSGALVGSARVGRVLSVGRSVSLLAFLPMIVVIDIAGERDYNIMPIKIMNSDK